MSISREIIIKDKTFILRNARDEDYNFTFNLLMENMLDLFMQNWGFWNDKSFAENYKIEQIRIIEENNNRVGYIDFKFKKDCGYINDIQLSKNVRNIGLGNYLMKMLEKETISAKLDKIRLKTFKNNRAVNLYNRLGYEPISEDETSMIMEKNLL